MGHQHGHCHHHAAPDTVNKLFIIAILANLAYTIVQAIFALHVNSMSLLADAGHNLGDVLSLTLAWGANWLLTRPSTQRYSYGFKRTSILTALVNGIILWVACALIIYGAIEKLIHPKPVGEITVMIVAAVGIVVNASTALLLMRGAKQDLNIKGAYLHLASDALVSVGVVLSAIILFFTGWLWLDPIVSLLIVVIILVGTWKLFASASKLLLDAVPDNVNQSAVKAYFTALEGVDSLHDLHIWALSTRDNALTVHLLMPNHPLTDTQLQTIRQDMQTTFNISHVTIQVEKTTGCQQCH